MQKIESISRNNTRSLKVDSPQQSVRRLGLCPQMSTTAGQQTSPVVFPEKRGKVKGLEKSVVAGNQQQEKGNRKDEHRIDIGGDEKANLLGSIVYTGKLSLIKKLSKSTTDVNHSSNKEAKQEPGVDAKLTSIALFWGSHRVDLDDVISVTYNVGVKHFTVHAYSLSKGSCGLSCVMKARRGRKDFCFMASNSEEALQWVIGFADLQCFINCLPHPLSSAKKQASSELFIVDTPIELHLKCKTPPKVLVILNPRSGRGRSTKVFHKFVEPIFKLAGFRMEVVNTTSAGHAKNLAATVDFSTCPDGIICVGGDGIVNEVLNGLLSRGNLKEAISIPVGIIPAGSDNSLVWTVLGVRDPIDAAIAIVKGGLTATDVLAVEWIQTGAIHYGMTVAYYGFVSDVLELSEKHQKRFGPLRYLVAGVLKFMCLPKYSFDVEYLPAEKLSVADHDIVDMQDLYTDIMRRSSKEGLPRASSLSSIDSIMSPTRMSLGDMDNRHASLEPSDLVRGIDPKSKRMSFGRSNDVAEPEVIHPQIPHSTTPNWPRTRSKSRAGKGWAGMISNDTSNRCSWANSATHDIEDISSTLSDPGPIWDSEPKWDAEPNWEVENPIELPGPPAESERVSDKDAVIRRENKWVSTKGLFLGVLVCNHACKTVQGFSSQVVAPTAEHDDNTLDLLLVHGSGRFRLLRFFLLLQFGKHLSLPYVEYVKVKSVKLKNCKNTISGCGIDGELLPVNGQVISSLLTEQCRLIGRSPLKNK